MNLERDGGKDACALELTRERHFAGGRSVRSYGKMSRYRHVGRPTGTSLYIKNVPDGTRWAVLYFKISNFLNIRQDRDEREARKMKL